MPLPYSGIPPPLPQQSNYPPITMIKFKIKEHDSRALIIKYLKLLSLVTDGKMPPISEKEAMFLSEALHLPEKFKYNRFSDAAKKHVKQQLKERYNWKVTGVNLNNKIYTLRDKGFIVNDEDGVRMIAKTLTKSAVALIDTFSQGKPVQINVEFEATLSSTDRADT